MTIEQIKKIATPILIKHGVSKAAIFGSVATQTHSSNSDIDILIELNDTYSLLDFVGIKLDMEDAVGEKVDLVEYDAIKPSLRKYIIDNPIYECTTVLCLGLKSLKILSSIATGLPTGQAGLSPWQLNSYRKWASCPIAWQAGSPSMDCKTVVHPHLRAVKEKFLFKNQIHSSKRKII